MTFLEGRYKALAAWRRTRGRRSAVQFDEIERSVWLELDEAVRDLDRQPLAGFFGGVVSAPDSLGLLSVQVAPTGGVS